jgi:hypothetical protein
MNSTRGIEAKFVLAAIALLGISAGLAQASTVDSFTFTQSGFSGGGTLTGSFTGTVEASGLIEQVDLSSFNAAYTVPLTGGGALTAYFYQPDVTLFSIAPGTSFVDGPNSSFDLAAVNALTGNVCSGAAAAFDVCGAAGGAVGFTNITGGASTTQFANLTLVSSTTTGPGAAAPEPASLGLCGLAALALVVALVRRSLAQRKGHTRRRETIYISRV